MRSNALRLQPLTLRDAHLMHVNHYRCQTLPEHDGARVLCTVLACTGASRYYLHAKPLHRRLCCLDRYGSVRAS